MQPVFVNFFFSAQPYSINFENTAWLPIGGIWQPKYKTDWLTNEGFRQTRGDVSRKEPEKFFPEICMKFALHIKPVLEGGQKTGNVKE